MNLSSSARPFKAASALALATVVAGATLGAQGCSSQAPEAQQQDETPGREASAQTLQAKLWILNRNGNPSLSDFWGCLLGHTGWNQLATQYAYPESLTFGKEAWVSGSTCNPGGPDDHAAFQCAVNAGGFDVSPYDIVLIIRDDGAAGGENDSGGGVTVTNPVTHANVRINTAEIGTGHNFGTWDYLYVYASHEVFEAQTDGVSGDCCDGETAYGGKFNWCPQCGGPSGACAKHQNDLGIDHLTCPSGHTYAYQKMSPPGAHEFDGTCVSFSVTGSPPPANACSHVPAADNGAYCGSSTESGFGGGSPLDLYDCQNGSVAGTTSCPFGCRVAPAGQADACYADPCTGVPASGNGAYCGASSQGGFKGGNSRIIYNCENGHSAGTTVCGGNCVVAPAGQADHC